MDRIGALAHALTARRDPEKAAAMAAYMKDQFPFLGVASPERRTAQREALGDWRAPTEDELSDFARACWAKDEREFQYAACDTLLRHVKRIGPDALDLCEDLITDKPWWDTTDALASRVVAFHARRPVLERWLTSGNLWLERTAIIHQLGDKQATDEAFLFHACLTHAASTDFFHRKAIGWALRQYAKVSPDTVRIFVADHADELSGLSKREALKHL
ncbi:MAG TPA: DNA alkylation repair protein [Acidimicrobiales bacterium]